MRPVDPADTTLVTQLIKLNPSMLVGGGMELIDRDLNVLADISENLDECSVARSFYATLHGSASFSITTQLSWGSALVRPYFLLGGSGLAVRRFNMGAYFTNTPDFTTGMSPTTYSVEGYDILDALDTDVGDSYAVQAGVEYLTAIETILLNQGFTAYSIDSARAGTVLPESRGWAMAAGEEGGSATWLKIVNDLLAAIGYRGIYSDWDGRLICEPYTSPSERTEEWTYDDGQYTSELGPQQTVKHDFYKTPNRWVGVRSNMPEGTTPSDGDGIFTYTNETEGETSVEARGRVIPTRIDIEAADQAALVTKVMQRVETDSNVGTTIDADTTANPLHWHGDILAVQTTELGQLKVLSTGWSLSFNGQPMTHNWSVIG